MKNYLIVLLLLFQFGQALAQHCCMNDTMIREIQFPMTERDTETVFCYFNNEWIGVSIDMVQADSIQKLKSKMMNTAIARFSLPYRLNISLN